MTPEHAVKTLIAEIRADRKQRADDLRKFCSAIDQRLAEFRTEGKEMRDEILGLKLVLLDTRKEFAERSAKQESNIRMLSDFTGMTEKKTGNGHGRGKR